MSSVDNQRLSVLPCPFCGSADIDTEGPSYTQFMCNSCGAATYDQPSREEAIAAWNRRSTLRAQGITKPDDGREWLPIETAPKNATEVLLRVPSPKEGRNARRMVGHWACDMSGEEQPPFRGWFYDTGYGFAEISPTPTGWMALPAPSALHSPSPRSQGDVE